MNQKTDTQNDVAAILIGDCSLPGTYIRASEAIIGACGGKTAETENLTCGSLKTIPSALVAQLHAIKKEFMRAMSQRSVKYGSGMSYLIKQSDLPEIEAIVDDCKTKFKDAVENLRQEYDAGLAKHIASEKVLAAAEILRKSALSADEVCAKCSFEVDIFIPKYIGKDADSSATLEERASKLSQRLYEEVAQAASELYNKSIVVKQKDGTVVEKTPGQKTKRPLRACVEKLKRMSFLDAAALSAAQIIEDVLALTPVSGDIEDTPGNPAQTRFKGLCAMMSSGANLYGWACKYRTATDKVAMLDLMTGVTKAVKLDVETVKVVEAIQQNPLPVEAEAVAETPAPLAKKGRVRAAFF